MYLYALIFPIISVIAIIWFITRYFKGKNSFTTVILWSIFWIVVSLFAIFPDISITFARIFGITRGLDFIIILVFVILFYTVLKLYFIVDKMQNNLNTLVKEVALNNEINVDLSGRPDSACEGSHSILCKRKAPSRRACGTRFSSLAFP